MLQSERINQILNMRFLYFAILNIPMVFNIINDDDDVNVYNKI